MVRFTDTQRPDNNLQIAGALNKNVLFIEMLHLSFFYYYFFVLLLFKRTLIIQTCNSETKRTFRLVNLFFLRTAYTKMLFSIHSQR